jgi:hypothetical protein
MFFGENYKYTLSGVMFFPIIFINPYMELAMGVGRKKDWMRVGTFRSCSCQNKTLRNRSSPVLSGEVKIR